MTKIDNVTWLAVMVDGALVPAEIVGREVERGAEIVPARTPRPGIRKARPRVLEVVA